MGEPGIVVVGSLNADLVADVDRFPGPGETVAGTGFHTFCGGKGANQAVAAARLGAGVAMVGRVGDDHWGRRQVENLAAAGVDTNPVGSDRTSPTGTAIIGVEPSGENRIIVVAGANASLTPDRLSEHAGRIRDARIVLLQLEIPPAAVGAAIEIARGGRATVVLDPAPAAPVPEGWLAAVDYLTPNASELGVLTGSPLGSAPAIDAAVDGARALLARGARHVIVKLGAAGAVLVHPDGIHHWPAPRVEAVDTTAAGDCFNAAFAVALLRGSTVEDAGRFAVAAATVSVTRRGAQASVPALEEVEAALGRDGR